MDNNLLHRGLPKWSNMVVTGERITEDQALEIIRRTDSFIDWPSGNNHQFIKKAKEILNLKDSGEFQDHREYFEWKKKFNENWGYIGDKLEYIQNRWISNSWIGGAYGWCHPNGEIKHNANIGKYPSVEEVLNEWIIIAETFPFLNIGITLMNGEDCEDDTEAVVSMLIKNGEVELIDPHKFDVHKGHEKDQIDAIGNFVNSYGKVYSDGRTRENGIPLDVIEKWAIIKNDSL